MLINDVSVGFKLLRPDVSLPSKGSKHSACYDIRAYLNTIDPNQPAPDLTNSPLTLLSGMVAKIPTGFATIIPNGYCAMIYSRSGLGVAGLTLANQVGIIDSDYRDEWVIAIRNVSKGTHIIKHNDRIAQFMIVPLVDTKFYLIDNQDKQFYADDRGGGFGSTGIN